MAGYGRRIGGHRWRALKAQVIAEEGGNCWLCGKPGANSADHIVPVSKAPWLELERGNVRACHLSCNQSRGDRPAPNRTPLVTTRDWNDVRRTESGGLTTWSFTAKPDGQGPTGVPGASRDW